MKNILITGGAGFVGSNLAVSFSNDNPEFNVIALDNLHRRGSELNVKRLTGSGVRFVHGDVRKMGDIASVGEIDLLIECSAEVSVTAGYDSCNAYVHETNLFGTMNCLEMCRMHHAGIIFLSTSRVYPIQKINNLRYSESPTRLTPVEGQGVPGMSAQGINEDFSLEGFRSIYGATKLCSELMIQEFIQAYDIKGVINRCGVITGPWQMGKVEQGFVALWVAKHLWGGQLSYTGYGGKGKQVRDILHIEDLYDLLSRQMSSMDELNGQVFNVGGGPDLSISLVELTAMCEEMTGNRLSTSSIPDTAKTDIPYYVSDCAKVREMTDWQPYQQKEKILQDIQAWLKENEEGLRGIVG